MIGNKILILLTNNFLKILFHKPLITLITKMHGITLSMLDHLLIPGFLTVVKNFKNLSQIGLRNGGYFLMPLKIFFVLKFANPFTTSKPTVKTFSLQETVIHSLSVLNLESLGFFVGNSLPIIFCQHHFLSFWLGNSKLNGGPLSKFPKPKHLSSLKDGWTHKNPKQKSPQSQRYLLGPNLCQAQLCGPKLLQKIHFLQIHLTGPI